MQQDDGDDASGPRDSAPTGSDYVPVNALTYWEILEPAVTPAVVAAARELNREPRTLYPPAVALALWAWQTRGIPAETNKIFRRRIVEEFVHLGMSGYTRGSRATYRSLLLAVAESVTPEHDKPIPIPRSEPTAPYTVAEIAVLRSWAISQGGASRRRDALVLLALGLGAGLATRELLAVRSTDLDWRDGVLHVLVWESRPRLVPVLPQWSPPLADLTIDDDRDRWAFRPGRQGIRSAQVTDFLHRGHQTELDVRPARMRTTWLLAHLAGGTPPRELLRIAGLENLAALDRIARFLPTYRPSEPLD